MEEVGSQVASPIVISQPLPGGFRSTQPMTKKRGVSVHAPNFVYQNLSDNWNPMSWDWDSTRFVAKPMQSNGNLVEQDQHIQHNSPRKMEAQNRAGNGRNIYQSALNDEHRGLKISGQDRVCTSGISDATALAVEPQQPMSRPNKRVRSGSPGSANYPMCQVDSCKEDLSTAKDYHRRHKVCDVHSKASEALVGKQMQRFCQQCSRFHPLSEFDEGKRSCRRRLAGHNKRRRKTQPEDITQQLSVAGNHNKSLNCDVDIVSLLSVLARSQGNHEDKAGQVTLIPDKDQLIQILSKINPCHLPVDKTPKPQMRSTNDGIPNPISSKNQNKEIGGASLPSTMDLLASFSTPPGLISDAVDLQSQPSIEESGSEKSASPFVNQAASSHDQRRSTLGSPSGSSPDYHSPHEDINSHGQGTSPSLPLQLFSSSPEDDSARKLRSGWRNYLSSSSSNPSEGRSPLSSPPVVYELFPMQTSKEPIDGNHLLTSENNNAYVKTSKRDGCNTSLQLFGDVARANDFASLLNSTYRVGYTSSESDHSPSSLISDVHDRTGRIVFKLFEKDPSQLPGSLRDQIFNWLSSSPSDMESYIRPGCVVLSLYLSMSSFAWEHLEVNLYNYVKALVRNIDFDFWGTGNFLIHTDRQMAFHNDGRIRLCKSLRSWSRPELISLSPVAIVGGEEGSLVLRGRRLTASGTKIHCTHPSEYKVISSPSTSHQDTGIDEICLEGFKIDLTTPNVLGRCFIEVENNIRGTSFPLIIADSNICQELRLLEPDIDFDIEVLCGDTVDHILNKARHSSRKEALHFLNELGWLFQRKHNSSFFDNPDYNLSRFRFLFIFSVEHDFCALTLTLLSILLELNLSMKNLANESLGMLAESHLLNKAVARKCRRMVDLLLHFAITEPNDDSKKYIFLPNMAGPGGVTPLHLAACSTSSDDIVDALTSDPHEIGLQCWNTVLDANGVSPYAYALMRNNNSYNTLVATKISNRQNDHVSVFIENEIEPFEMERNVVEKTLSDRRKSCSRCALITGSRRMSPYSQGFLQRHYIHSVLFIAAVCVCVCLFLRTRPYVGFVAPFAWDNLGYGAI